MFRTPEHFHNMDSATRKVGEFYGGEGKCRELIRGMRLGRIDLDELRSFSLDDIEQAEAALNLLEIELSCMHAFSRVLPEVVIKEIVQFSIVHGIRVTSLRFWVVFKDMLGMEISDDETLKVSTDILPLLRESLPILKEQLADRRLDLARTTSLQLPVQQAQAQQHQRHTGDFEPQLVGGEES